MNGVKGFIFKELYLRRKSFLSGAAIYIMLFILAASFCLSLDCGNMKNNGNVSPDTAVMLAYALAAAGIVIVDGQYGEVIGKDIKCKWNIFEYTLPLSVKKKAAIRAGILCGTHLLATAVSTLLSAIIFKMAHSDFTVQTAANITVFSIIFLIMIITGQFLVLKLKDPQKAVTWFMGIYLLICIPIVRFAVTEMQNSEMPEEEFEKFLTAKYLTPLTELRDGLFPFSPLIFAAIAVIGYFLFLDAFKRREK